MTTDAAQQREPDGRPLYAYKWHDASYERLKTAVRTQLPEALRSRATHRFAAMFCVYAAETFRWRPVDLGDRVCGDRLCHPC